MRIPLFAAVLTMALHATAARAAPIQFDASWTSAGSAAASGTVTLDDAVISNSGFFQHDSTPFLLAIEITVTGASSGNGTFTLVDLDAPVSYWNSDGTVDLDQEIVGQSGFFDFNIFSSLGAPHGVSPNTMITNSGSGDTLTLASLSPMAVPEPSTGLLLCVGLGLLAARRRGRAR